MAMISYLGVVFLSLFGFLGLSRAQLQLGFYAKSCPKAEKIVHDFVNKHIQNAPSLAASFIRMHFHDCFVRGCDASVLLNSTSGNVEKDAIPNQTLTGFGFIDSVKSLLEDECPGIVSCADILTLVARDSIVATGGPFWKVPTGRRDGRISIRSEAQNDIPGPFDNFTSLQQSFANEGLDLKDLVLLSGELIKYLTGLSNNNIKISSVAGAHTIGVSHCPVVSRRLYNFTGVGDQDPALDSEYAANLKARKCTTPTDNTTLLEMDPGSRKTFDLSYYTLLLKRRGLFVSDAALTTNAFTLSFIKELLQGSLENFFAEFAKSMEKMGRIKVKTGSDSEIRKQCAFVN